MSKDTKGEGCGIHPILLRGWPLTACEKHDAAYLVGSWHQANMSRAEVDRRFRLMLFELAKEGRFRLGKKALAWAMWGAARLLGGFWWEGKR